ncbi:hypothetical protein TRAPUB_29 [Trametes pubescens]|uniref:Membrane anchor Opy2 N-terminal domain-containing protein n=1 Tax=Trametes pubescens TaxID=154538 RepID=A0A1M2VNF4_TRAPU|nr:hypothetical protein TRAPUB_29 [Trametes pubescens]
MFDQAPRRFHPRQTGNQTDSNGCLVCPDEVTNGCNCAFNQQCILINRTSSKGGVSKGAVAAAVVVIILVLAGAVAAFFWYRRRQRLQRNTAPEQENKPDVPARAEDVLNREDPHEKVSSPPPQLSSIRIFSGSSNGTINLDPAAPDASHSQPSHRGSIQSNPFEDNHSIQTSSTGAQSNVIPIALVPPGSVGNSSVTSAMSHSHDGYNAAHAGMHARSDVNLDHVNVSNDSLNPRGGASNAASARSGVNDNNTAYNNNRSSYMTTGSFASDFLETSVIITPTRGTVKQVVGVAKAEVLHASPSDSLSRSSTLSKARSPLAASSFGPADVMQEAEEEQEITAPANPFSDSNSPYPRASPTPSATTFGTPEPSHTSYSRQSQQDANWLQEDPAHLYGHSSNDSRPASVYTQASAIIADISSAKRVHLGFDQMQAMPNTPLSAALSTPRSNYRMTNAKLVSPVVQHSAAIETGGSANAGALEQQQARALQELAAESGKNRMSMASVMTTSTRADSILESFPFVPPSPISNRPIRTPPRSPLTQQSFAGGAAQDDRHVSAQETVNRARASASSSSMLSALAPPNRKVLGMSVSSQSSTVSNGLGSFTFQIDSGTSDNTPSSPPPSAYSGSDGSSMRKRASLDTLALTSDLSSYPLGFDKGNAPPVPQVPRR